uniref:Uncharacterized protein n=1 Tax=Setaria viridis TaxID=4556 RepID=A0A4U6VSQ3_SETVI|nr:hypothetical protein SEVIR_2G195350v2 [Setaria viridis]
MSASVIPSVISNASPGSSFYSRGRGFWSCFVVKMSGAFNYCPLLLPGHLDGAPFNNCPGYSRSHCLFLLPCPLSRTIFS